MLLGKQDLRGQMAQFAELFEMVFERKADLPSLAWRYLDNPLDARLFVNIEFVNGAMVANYSASPFRLLTPDGNANALLSMTTMTHPSQKGKGLFPKLASELYARAAEDGYALVMGFPNVISHLPFVEKLGWQDVYEIPMFSIDLRALPLSKQSVAEAVRDDQFQFELREPAWLKKLLRVERGRDWLHWRFAANPSHAYHRWCLIDGDAAHSHIVVKRFEGQLDIVDLVPRDAEASSVLLEAVRTFAVGAGSTMLNLWLQPHVPHRGGLERAGCKPGGPVTYFGVRTFAGWPCSNGQSAAPFQYRNWFLQMSDSDVF